MKRRQSTVYAPSVEQLIEQRDAEKHKGNVVRIARKNAHHAQEVAA